MAKPADFFVGVTDLFSVILPGAALAYVCYMVEKHIGSDVLGFRALGTYEGYLAFFVAAYLLGNVMDMVGAAILDNIYDLTYAHWKRSDPMSLKQWWQETPPRMKEEWVSAVRAIKETRKREHLRLDEATYREAERLAGSSRPQGFNVYKWTRSWIAVYSSSAFAEVERMQANSKFFRGMVTLSVITAFLSATIQCPFRMPGAGACLLLAVAFFFRYSDLRWKAVQQTYGFYLVLRNGPVPLAVDAARESAPPGLRPAPGGGVSAENIADDADEEGGEAEAPRMFD